MKRVMVLPAILCFACSLAYAETWTGALVDSKCYASEERNVNPFEPFDVSHDRAYEVRACRPNSRTKLFTVVEQDGQSFQLDAAGNSKATELVRNSNKKSMLVVSVSGERQDDTIKVDTLTLRN